MKIAIITGHFMPEVGYQEVYLARSFAKAGHSVRVFTSTSVSPSSKKVIKQKYEEGLSRDKGFNYEVQRLKTDFEFRSIVYSKHLYDEAKKFNPDLIVIIGIGKLFPAPLLKQRLNCRYATVFGDNKEYRDRRGLLNKFKSAILDFGFSLFKKRYYVLCVRISDVLILNVPETEYFFNSILNKKDKKRFDEIKYPLNLGFDDEEYYFDKELRDKTRKEFGIDASVLSIVCITKVVRGKYLEKVIKVILNLLNRGYKIHFTLGGLLDDEYELELTELINSSKFCDNFHLIGFINHTESLKYYCMGDVGLWTRAAISIQEAMGTGLKVIIPNKESVSHLLKAGFNGWYYNDGELENKIIECYGEHFSNSKYTRDEIRKYNYDFLSYNIISDKIIKRVDGEI